MRSQSVSKSFYRKKEKWRKVSDSHRVRNPKRFSSLEFSETNRWVALLKRWVALLKRSKKENSMWKRLYLLRCKRLYLIINPKSLNN